MNSTVAMVLTGVDGHIVACNDAFTSLSGYTRQEVLSTSIFNMTLPEEMTQMFQMVSTMLSFPQERTKHFTKTCKFQGRDEFCFVSMWIVREDDGEPLYFQMVMVPMAECAGIVGTNMEADASMPSLTGPSCSSGASDDDGMAEGLAGPRAHPVSLHPAHEYMIWKMCLIGHYHGCGYVLCRTWKSCGLRCKLVI